MQCISSSYIGSFGGSTRIIKLTMPRNPLHNSTTMEGKRLFSALGAEPESSKDNHKKRSVDASEDDAFDLDDYLPVLDDEDDAEYKHTGILQSVLTCKNIVQANHHQHADRVYQFSRIIGTASQSAVAPVRKLELVARTLILDQCLSLALIKLLKDKNAVIQNEMKQIVGRGVNGKDIARNICEVLRRLVCNGPVTSAMLDDDMICRVAAAQRIIAWMMTPQHKMRFQLFTCSVCNGSIDFFVRSHGNCLMATTVHASRSESRQKVQEQVGVVRRALAASSLEVSAAEKAMGCISTIFKEELDRQQSEALIGLPRGQPMQAITAAAGAFAPKSPVKGVRTIMRHKHGNRGKNKKMTKQEEAKTLPFGLAQLKDAQQQHRIMHMHSMAVSGIEGVLKTTVMQQLARCAVECFSSYSNGLPLDRVCREVTDLGNSPRYGPFFEFLTPHIAITHTHYHTSGDGMFEAFDMKKRLQQVAEHYKKIVSPKTGTPDGIIDMRGFSGSKSGDRCMFVNEITSFLFMVHTTAAQRDTAEDPIDFSAHEAVFVVVDHVRASYKNQQSDQAVCPGMGVFSIRRKEFHVFTCDHTLRDNLKNLMHTVREENNRLKSPELLLDHAFVHSEVVTSGSLLCNHHTLMQGLCCTIAIIANEQNAKVIDKRQCINGMAFLLKDASEVVYSAMGQFHTSFNEEASVCATHTAIKVFMQSLMTAAEQESLEPDDVASLIPHRKMFSAGVVDFKQVTYKRLMDRVQGTQHLGHAQNAPAEARRASVA